MSASTVSVTPNPAARRRPVVASEVKKNFEMVLAEGTAPMANGVVSGGDDAANAKDLSNHSIRGEVLLERSSRDLLQVKKNVANPTSSHRRSRKVPTKPDKPRRVTIVSVFVKNFVLLLVIMGLVQTIWRLALKSSNATVGTQFGLSEFEGRIAEVESFLKKTTKMIQVQVDVVDRKIENEIGGLRSEMDKIIEDREAVWENDLKRLETKSEGLERSLGELNTVDWISKQEFEKIYEDLMKGKNGEFRDGSASLDDIRAYAKEMVKKEIEKHAADGLGKADYALASAGAMVVKHSEAYLGRTGSLFSIRNEIHEDADKMLKPSFGEPGQCFALKGSTGFVQIKLRTAIIPEAITLEHVAKSVAYDRSSALKDFRVSGWLEENSVGSEVSAEKMFVLGEFTYDLEKSNAQSFDVIETANSGVVDTVRIDFSSNHGSPSYTCIYRLRVHGHEPDSVLMMAMEPSM